MEAEEKWMPKIGGKYYRITNSNVGRKIHKHIWKDSEFDNSCYNSSNCFKSKKETNFTLKMFGKAW